MPDTTNLSYNSLPSTLDHINTDSFLSGCNRCHHFGRESTDNNQLVLHGCTKIMHRGYFKKSLCKDLPEITVILNVSEKVDLPPLGFLGSTLHRYPPLSLNLSMDTVKVLLTVSGMRDLSEKGMLVTDTACLGVS